MCKIRALKYACGHTTLRRLSTCRGTYADPRGHVVLCNSGPELTVSIPESCSNCQYRSFREDWEAKLAEAQSKHFVALQMMREFENDEEACTEMDEDTNNLIGSAGDRIGDGFGDAQMAARERQRAENELTRLKEQYEREALTKWNALMKNEKNKSSMKSLRKRRPAPKRAGRSSLSHVTTLDDVDQEAAEEREGDDNKSSKAMVRSPSLTSDSSETTDSDDETDYMPPPRSTIPARNWSFPDTDTKFSPAKTGTSLAIKNSLDETAITDDDRDSMFPDYGF